MNLRIQVFLLFHECASAHPSFFQELIAQSARCAGPQQYNRHFFSEVTTSPFESVGQG